LSQYIADIIESNDLISGHYVEPYAGGAGVAISLLFLEYVSRIHINDISRSVYAFWYSVLYEAEGLCRLISRKRVSMEEWRRQRDIQSNPNATLLDRGFSTFFLNRTNRSGIIFGGVIGGQNQDGRWKLDARYNKKNLIKRIESIAKVSNRIKLYNMDAADYIRDVLPGLPNKTFIYLDPPYYIKGKGLYEDHYQHHDHEKIAKLISEINQRWMVSYDNVPEIRSMYGKYRKKKLNIHYSAHDRYKGSEVLIYCDKLKVPNAIATSRASLS